MTKRIQVVHVQENLGDLNPTLPFVDVSDGYIIRPSDSALRVTGAVDSIVTLPIQDLVTIVGTKSGPFTIGETISGSVSGATGLVVSQTAEYIIVQMTSVTQFGTSDTITGGTSHATITAITSIDAVMLPIGKTIAVSNNLSPGTVTVDAIGGPTVGNSTDGTFEAIAAFSAVTTFRWDGTMWWVLGHAVTAPPPPPATPGMPYILLPSSSVVVDPEPDLSPKPKAPPPVHRLAISITTVFGLPVAGDLTPGTIEMYQIRAGVRTLVYTGIACDVDTGLIYHDDAFYVSPDPADWHSGDNWEARFDSQAVTIAGTTYPLPPTYLQGVIDEVAMLASRAPLIIEVSYPAAVSPDTVEDLSISITTGLGIPLAADIVPPGTISIIRVRGGVETPIVADACAAADGRVYYNYTFPSGSWQANDEYKAVFTGQIIIVAGVPQPLSDIRCKGIIVGTSGPSVTQQNLPNFYEGWQLGSAPDPDIWAIVQSSGFPWVIYVWNGHLCAFSIVGSLSDPDHCSLSSIAVWEAMPTFGVNSIPQQFVLEFELRLADLANIDETATFFGLAPAQDDDLTVQNIIGFAISSSDLISVTDDAGSRTVSPGMGVTLTDLNKLKIVVRAGAVDFYVDEVLMATHTTDIPTVAEHLDFYAAALSGVFASVGIGQLRCDYK